MVFVDRSSTIIIPFSGRTLDLGIFYPVVAVILVVGIGNGMNFTDGLDGLAAGVAAIGLGAYCSYRPVMLRPCGPILLLCHLLPCLL